MLLKDRVLAIGVLIFAILLLVFKFVLHWF
jgi:hypothetical protein